jgi:exonuclease VII small subunit
MVVNADRVGIDNVIIMDPTTDFESAVAELDTIVKRRGGRSAVVNRSRASGVQLARFCHSKLEGAERRIELLNERGEIKDAPPALGLGTGPLGTK